MTAALMVAGYRLYLAVWSALIPTVSFWVRQRSVALGVLVFVWLLAALVIPRIGIDAGSAAVDAPGKIASDLAMLAEQRKLGDGHNAADPAFAALLSPASLVERGLDRLAGTDTRAMIAY